MTTASARRALALALATNAAHMQVFIFRGGERHHHAVSDFAADGRPLPRARLAEQERPLHRVPGGRPRSLAPAYKRELLRNSPPSQRDLRPQRCRACRLPAKRYRAVRRERAPPAPPPLRLRRGRAAGGAVAAGARVALAARRLGPDGLRQFRCGSRSGGARRGAGQVQPRGGGRRAAQQLRRRPAHPRSRRPDRAAGGSRLSSRRGRPQGAEQAMPWYSGLTPGFAGCTTPAESGRLGSESRRPSCYCPQMRRAQAPRLDAVERGPLPGATRSRRNPSAFVCTRRPRTHGKFEAQARSHHRRRARELFAYCKSVTVRAARRERHRLAHRERGAGRRRARPRRRSSFSSRTAARSSTPASPWTTTASRPLDRGRHRGRPPRARRWPRPTACRSSCTPTTAPRSCCPGSTACSPPARRTSREHGEPLFSSHMLDLSEEPLHENLEICRKYLDAHGARST